MTTSPPEVFPFPYQPVFDSAAAVMPTLGIMLKFADPSQGMIQAKRGMNLVTYGENIGVAVWPIDEYATGVQIASTLVFGFDLWGRNQRNIAKINAAMSLYLDTWAPHLRRPRAD